jgi:hypothetical protein
MNKLVFLTLLLVGLAAFVYFYEIEGEEKREEARKLEESVVRLEREAIQGLRIEREGTSSIELKRDGDNWFLKDPLETQADQSTVDSLLRNLTDAKRARTFEEGGKSATDYGLDDPAVRLTVEAEAEKKVLLVGNKDFTGNELYVMFEGGSQVFLTSGLILTSLDKQLLDWRDKSIVSFERDKLQELRIQRASEEITLVMQDDQWSLMKPVQEPADEGTVSSLLSTLETSKVQEFVEEDAEDLREFGLDSPSLIVQLRQEGEDSWRQLELGSENEDKVFARNPLKSAVFTVEKDLLKELFQEVWEFRSKEVVDVDQGEIAKLRIDRKDSQMTVRHEDFKWFLEAPEGEEEKEVLAYKFWYPIDDIEFEAIAEEGAVFPESEVRIIITLDDGSERSFEFARQADKFMARQVESGRQGEISRESFEKLEFKVEDITS